MNRTKKMSIILLALFVSVGFSIAETTVADIPQSDEMQTITMPLDNLQGAKYINQIAASFCDDGINSDVKDYDITIKQGEPRLICLLLVNTSDTDLTFWVNMASQELSNMGSKACRADYDTGFANYIQMDIPGDIVIPANSYVTRTLRLFFPFGTEGVQEGCVAYGVHEDFQQGTMLSIISRKVLYIQATIDGAADIIHNASMQNVRRKKIDNETLGLTTTIVNYGNIATDVAFTTTVSGPGIETVTTTESNFLNIGEEIQSTGAVSLGGYGIYKIQVDTVAQARFENGNDVAIDNHEDTKTLYYIHLPWSAIVVLFVILFVIVLLTKGSKSAAKHKNKKQ